MLKLFEIRVKVQSGIYKLLIEEKSLHHVAMIATFLDDNKPKMPLNIYCHLICQMLVKFPVYIFHGKLLRNGLLD